MGCGNSKERNETKREIKKEIKQEIKKEIKQEIKQEIKKEIKQEIKDKEVFSDPLANYLNIIKNGVVYLDYDEMIKTQNIIENEAVTINGVDIFTKVIKDEEVIKKLLSSSDKLLKLREEIKHINKSSELGIYYKKENNTFVLFLVMSKSSSAYEEDLSQLITSNKLSLSTHFEFSDKLSFSSLLTFLNALKMNQTIKCLDLSLITDDFFLSSALGNLMTNNNLEKIKCSKLGITEESFKNFNDFFKFNTNLSNLKIDSNKIESFESVKESILNNPNLFISSLNINSNKISNFNNLKKIVSSTKENKKLQKLKLSKCNLTNINEFNILFPIEQIQLFSNLTNLDLSFNFVNLEFLVNLMNSGKSLRKLTLQKIKFDSNEKINLTHLGEAYINSGVENLSINFHSNDIKLLKDFFTGFSNLNKSNNNKKNFKLFKSNLEKETSEILFKGVVKSDSFNSLDLSYCTIDFESLDENLSNPLIKNLTILNLANCNLKENDFTHLYNFISKNPSITTLELEKNSFALIPSIEAFCDNFNKNIKLTKLNLDFCFNQNTNNLFKDFCNLLQMKNLNELSLQNCEFPNDTFGEEIATLLTNNIKIKILKLGSKDEIYKPNVNGLLLKALSLNKELEDFTFTNIKVNKENLSEFLESMPQLKTLNLINVTVNTHFMESILKLKKLENLNISLFNFTDDDAAENIKKFIISNNKLISLIIDVPNITSKQIEIILDGLKTNHSFNKFQIFPKREQLPSAYNEGVQKYYKYVKECISLTDLQIIIPRISENNEETITKENLEKLKNLYQNFTI